MLSSSTFSSSSQSTLSPCGRVDPQLAYSQPKSLLAPAAYDALSHAVESLFSVMASEFTIPLSLQVNFSHSPGSNSVVIL